MYVAVETAHMLGEYWGFGGQGENKDCPTWCGGLVDFEASICGAVPEMLKAHPPVCQAWQACNGSAPFLKSVPLSEIL